MTGVQSSVRGTRVWLFSHHPIATFLQGFQIYLPLFQMLWVCTSGTGVLGWCPRDTTVSWFIWRYDKMLCSRCDEWGRITFLHFVATMACFFLHRNEPFIKKRSIFTNPWLISLSIVSLVAICLQIAYGFHYKIIWFPWPSIKQYMLVSVHTSQFEINKHNDLILKARLKINICIYAYPHTCERYFLLPYFTRLVMLALHVIRKQI